MVAAQKQPRSFEQANKIIIGQLSKKDFRTDDTQRSVSDTLVSISTGTVLLSHISLYCD